MTPDVVLVDLAVDAVRGDSLLGAAALAVWTGMGVELVADADPAVPAPRGHGTAQERRRPCGQCVEVGPGAGASSSNGEEVLRHAHEQGHSWVDLGRAAPVEAAQGGFTQAVRGVVGMLLPLTAPPSSFVPGSRATGEAASAVGCDLARPACPVGAFRQGRSIR